MNFYTIIPNAAVFFVCAWAALNPKVHIGFIGTLATGVIGVASIINMQYGDFFGMLSPPVALIVNILAAVAAILCAMRHKESRKHNRRLFTEQR